MQVFKSIIIDDDPLVGITLQSMINRDKALKLQDYFSNPYTGLTYIQNERPDVVFLDVEMPEISGLDFVKLLDASLPVILISMQPKYAASGFDLRVLDFLRKPITYPRFQQSINRLKQYYKRIRSPLITSEIEHLYIKDSRSQQWLRIELSKINWIEAKGDYATINTLEKRHTIYTSMKKLLRHLPESRFLRVHRSYIVNLKHIDTIEGNTLCLKNKLIPLGGVYSQKLFDQLNMI